MSETELSFGEEQLWRAEQPDATTLPFIDCTRSLSAVVRLENALNRPALRASLDEIVRRHEVLRSKFVVRHGRPVRLLRQSSSAELTVSDLRGSDPADREALVAQVLERHVVRRFDLTRGPLLRATLLVLSDTEHILAVTVHHIVFDRWSKRVLARELKQLYDAHAAGRTPGLEPLRARYADYVRWQRERLESAFSRELVAYWTERLSGLTDLTLSGDRGRTRAPSARAGKWIFTIPAHDTSRLRATSRQCRVTLTTVTLAIFKLFLRIRSGRDDIAVGLPLSDRRHPDFEPLIGLFANVVVVRTAVADRLTFLELVERVRRALFDACRYQDLPYGHLLKVIGTERPLHRVVFNFLPDIAASEVALEGLRVTPMQVDSEHPSQADLSLHVRQDSGTLACRLVYKADLFSAAWAETFATQFQTLVTAVLDAPQKEVRAYGADWILGA